MLSFKQRAAQFWLAFSTEEENFYSSLKSGKKRPVVQRISFHLDKIMPVRFELHAPRTKNSEKKTNKYQLEFSAQGNKLRAFLLEMLIVLQPKSLKHFECMPYISATPLDQVPTVVVQQQPFKLDSMRFHVAPSTHGANYDVTVSYPPFKGLGKEERLQLASYALDIFLGELWGSELFTITGLSAEEIPMSLSAEELVHYIHQKIKEEELPNIDSYFDLYVSFKNPHPSRSANPILDDVISGNSSIPRLMQDFFDIQEEKNDQAPYHALARVAGAETGFLYFKLKSRTDVIEGDHHFLELLLRDYFEENPCGKVVGSAIGHVHFYIELLLLDTEMAFTHIQNLLHSHGLQGYYQSYHPAEPAFSFFDDRAPAIKIEVN